MSKPMVFIDGNLKGIAISGSIIKADLTPVIPLKSQTVGFNRFYRAKNEDIKVAKVVRVPYCPELLDAQHVEAGFYREKKQKDIFKVVQVQELLQEAPPCLQLSLERVKTNFKDER